ncbi:MAG: ABC transporter ATP-binding protein, partial [Candidatus Omnitrophota bacterium]|nr:ABC transporter ATP-binding protein [Candidatus Omnitrophota bacterium]
AANVILLLGVSFFSACSMFTIAPLVDFLVNPGLDPARISMLTQKAIAIMAYVKLPVTPMSWLAVLTLFVALSSAFQIFANYSILRTKYAVAWDIMRDTFKDFFNAQWSFFTGGSQGVILNTFTREVVLVGDAFGAMAQFFANGLQVVFFLAVPFFISWKATTLSVGAAVIFAVPFLLLGRLSYRLGVESTEASNKMISVVQESFGLAKIILGFGNHDRTMRNLDNAFGCYCKSALRSQTLNLAIPLSYRPFIIIIVTVAFFASRWFGVALSETLVLLLSLQQVGASIGVLTMQKNSLQNFFPSYEQIMSLRQRARELEQKAGGMPFMGFSREVRIEGVSFAYPGRENVITEITTRIPKGKMVAFVGESGAGKSTLVDMIMGFHKPTSGRILFDGIDMSGFDILSYRRRIGYVPQDSILFNMSIKDNFLWANESATRHEMEEACQQANADEFIGKLPKGFDTIVGDRGIRLSGGQVQRIALARAILRRPELLILDEATSSLDTYSERLIQQAIEKIVKSTTVIVIAHRLSTIVNSDYIYVLKKGRIAEEGPYSKLIREKGHFNSMVTLQALETVDTGR